MYDYSIMFDGGVILIQKMTKEYEEELIKFLYMYNCKKESFIAWLPENYEEIVKFNKDSFYLSIEADQIVGCMGTYCSAEQKVVRLLGPIVQAEFFDQYANLLYEKCLMELPMDMKEVKIAFFENNKLCRQWCEEHNFELYNAERTMVYSKSLEVVKEQSCDGMDTVIIRPYEPEDKEGLAQVHPKGVFYTLEELVGEISEQNRLLVTLHGKEVVGYVFYEVTSDKSVGEITLLHVKDGVRGKGYGSQLLRKAIITLEQDQVSEICINVRVENEGAFRLYNKMGFIEKETVYAYRKSLIQ